MQIWKPQYTYSTNEEHGIIVTLEEPNLKDFSANLLGLGDLTTPSKPLDVLAVLFDLEGFTNFTRQVDPQLTVPEFISEFLIWLFDKIKDEIVLNKKQKQLWAELPFFSKFMGDGVLFLWKLDLDKIIAIDQTRPTKQIQYEIQEFICNIIATLLDVCNQYNYFLKHASQKYVSLPSRLRCGISRGTVIPIGNGSDFVGPCINIASRLQKFYGLSFVFSARGIDSNGFSDDYNGKFSKKRSAIRGIGENELVYVLKDELETLDQKDKNHLKEP